MKNLIKKLAFWMLRISNVNTFAEIDNRMSKLANGRYYSFSVSKKQHSKLAGSVNGIFYTLYIDSVDLISDYIDLNKAFEELESKINNPQSTKEEKEFHF